MGDRGVKRIERSREGVPGWDGDASTYQEYAEAASMWEQSIPYHKRYLCGPKLVQELSGTAKRFVMSQDPSWVSFAGGVQVLLEHLRQHLGLPQLAEMSDYMGRYFRFSKRKRHEPMSDYITRKSELYARTCQSLFRVQQRYQRSGTSGIGQSQPRYSGSTAPGQNANSDVPSQVAEDDDEDYEDAVEPEPGQADPRPQDDPWSSYRHWRWDDWNYGSSRSWQDRDWYSDSLGV